MGWWQRWRDWRAQRVLARHDIPPPLWDAVLARYPFLHRLAPGEREALRALSSAFLARKEFSGAQGLVVTDEMAVAIAAQACLPILHLDLSLYDGFVGIVVHPDEVVARRHVTDPDGVVHEYDEWLSGEAMAGGPVMLSWPDVDEAGDLAIDGYNVVVHEFAHVIDMCNGEADGVPPQPSSEAQAHWIGVLDGAWEDFCHRLDAGLPTLLDAYAAEGPQEFFAVSVEAFFVNPQPFRQHHPDLHAMLVDYFHQDPAMR
ncbi:zinc-dependent peptidase [Ideonella sp. NS12-5]|uniref:Zinc-dependent peptidase n=2 Tax=Ideonella oryzae TaxID=2937441 RepID=A0ABT1BTF6_9BURK|nr:M90 family metallopeptidase [Ideonella oryzae]MCO5979124.1 zinc-dependent peptidase [Ideonella oryzae]